MSWFKKIFSKETPAEKAALAETQAPAPLSKSLDKTRRRWTDGIASLFFGKKQLSAELLEELETHLLAADVGVETTKAVIAPLVDGLARKSLQDGEVVYNAIKAQLVERLAPVSAPLVIPETTKPFLILVVGVNGVGKTTTIAKLANQLKSEGKKVMLAAGDTFRAAAIEQLQQWGEHCQMPVVAQGHGADSAAVIFDAWQSACAKQMDVLIADTAGRLHTQAHLMEELKKIKRVLNKLDPSLPHETLLVLDASVGQNAMSQAKHFHEAVGVTGLALTKLDGTAKGGIVFALSSAYSIPLRYIGVGEGVGDLRPFDANGFVEAIFEHDTL